MSNVQELWDAIQSAPDPLAELLRIERERADERVRRAVQSGKTDWDRLVRGIGRNDLPMLLMCVWERLLLDDKAVALAETWTAAEYPEQQWDRHTWIPLFREVGFIYEDRPGIPPSDPITLWRGGTKKTRMSWTADRDRAEWFAHRWDDLGRPGRLYTATVQPDRLLAYFDQESRGEAEYVIDPTGLRHKVISL